MTRKFVKRSIFFTPNDLIFVTDSLNLVLMTFSDVYFARKSLYETAVHHLQYEPVNLTWGGLGGLTPKPKNQLPQRSQTLPFQRVQMIVLQNSALPSITCMMHDA